IYKNFIWLLLIIFSLFFIIINLVVCMMIMIKKWENKWSIKNRIAYGFLSFFLLPFSGILIFSLKAIKNCKDENNNDLDANGFVEEPFDITVFNEIDLKDDE
ncbi:MAG: hypothetical protein K2L64_02270, partial [Ureaplasma sp.]|nr:hypothetical protein [Ureaplasma sp.]